MRKLLYLSMGALIPATMLLPAYGATPISSFADVVAALQNGTGASGSLTTTQATVQTLTTAAAQAASGYFLPFLNASASIVVGEQVSGTGIPANTYVLAVSPGTTAVTGQTAPFAMASGQNFLPVSSSTGIQVGMVIRDSAASLNQTAIVAGVIGGATAPVTLTSPTATAGGGGAIITVTSGGASCLPGMTIFDITQPTAMPAGYQVYASTATSITISNNVAVNVVSSDVVQCFPTVEITTLAMTGAIAAGDAYTFYPGIGINQLTTTGLASGASVTFTPNTSTVNSTAVQAFGPVNAGSSGFQINGQTVLTATGGISYQNFPQDVTLVGIGAGAAIPPAESLMTAMGWHAFNLLQGPNSESTGFGYHVGGQLVFGGFNNLFGINALGSCQYGCGGNLLMGTDAARNSTAIYGSIGLGNDALLNHNGTYNIAIGTYTLQGNTSGTATGSYNVAVGAQSFNSASLTSAFDNTAIGSFTGQNCTACNENVLAGYMAGLNVSTDSVDTILGYQAGTNASGGFGMTLVGAQAGYTATAANSDTFVGYTAGKLVTGSANTIIGNGAGNGTLTNGTFNILMGVRDTGAGGSDTPTAGAQFYLNIGNTIIADMHTPLATGGFGTSPTTSGTSSAGFKVVVGTGGTASTGTVTFNANDTAPTGWACNATDITTTSATVFVTKSVPLSTNSVTLTNYNTSGAAAAWVAGDVLVVSCNGF